MNENRKELVEIVARAVPAVWDAIGYDIGSVEGVGSSIPAADVVELCVDANRMATFGQPDAEAAKDLLIEEIGYSKFLKVVAAALPYSRYEC